MPTLALFLSMPVAWMWRAFILTKLWSWFLVPAGAPRLPFLAAMGLSLVSAILMSPMKVDKNESTVDGPYATKLISYAFVIPGFVLLMGWGLHLFTA